MGVSMKQNKQKIKHQKKQKQKNKRKLDMDNNKKIVSKYKASFFIFSLKVWPCGKINDFLLKLQNDFCSN